jgi:hypothetical protein
MEKDNCESHGDGLMAITTMSGESDNWVSGYCRICCSIYIFQAKFSKEASASGINGGRIIKLCVMCVEEAGKHLKQNEVANYDNGWVIKPEEGNNEVAITVILHWLGQLPPEAILE